MPQLTIQQRYAQLDAAARRRFRRDYMPGFQAQDLHDLELAVDQGNNGHGWPALRNVLLQRAIVAWGAEYTLHASQLAELEQYLDEGGEWPRWATAVSGQDINARRMGAAVNPPAVVTVGRKPMVVGDHDAAAIREELKDRAGGLKPDAEGRYPGQEPRGRFAEPGSEEFSPDPR